MTNSTQSRGNSKKRSIYKYCSSSTGGHERNLRDDQLICMTHDGEKLRLYGMTSTINNCSIKRQNICMFGHTHRLLNEER